MKKLELFEEDSFEEEYEEADDAGLTPEESAFLRGWEQAG